MSSYGSLLLAVPAVAALGAVYSVVRTLVGVRRLDLAPPEPPRWPKISIVVPACNEADTLADAMRAKLASDYPNLEIVLVDDRSTDETGAIVDRLAAEDARIVPLHIDRLPEGWLGKLHAMHVGARAATGEWLLFSDADVHLAPGLLRRAVAVAEQRRLDFMTMVPHLWTTGIVALDAALTSFLRIGVSLGRLWAVSDPLSRAAVGGGLFNMVRRSAFERTPGFEWLRLEITDDLAFGQMMKRSGARCAVFNGRDDVCLYFYRTVREMAGGFEKSFGGTKAWPVIATCLGLLFVELAPLAFLTAPERAVRAVAVAIILVTTCAQVAVARWSGRPAATGAVPFVGASLLFVVALRSAVLAHARGGVRWRGTWYSSAALRAGRRVELF
ncbi:MAG: glycosyltransferase [Labilithrix sp.]|nr:glycosyltransferase [Labilithrix sp.]MCW5813112.1 glycosyltransferase [Labilithrix sp.]